MNNTTRSTELLPIEPKDIPQILIFIIGFLGNLVVISAIILDKRLRTSLNYLVLNLSFCNICVVIFSIPFQLLVKSHGNDFIFGEPGCWLIYPFATWAVNVSVSSLLTITIDRYIAIVHPMMWRSCQKHTFKIIFVNHLYGYVTIVPYAAHIRLKTAPTGQRYCHEIWDPATSMFYTILLFLLQYLIPLSFMIFFYTSAWVHLKRQNDHTIRLSEEARTARSMSLRLHNEDCEIRARFARRSRTKSVISTTYSGEVKDMCLLFCLKAFRSSNYDKRNSSETSYDNADFFIANGRRRQTIRTFFMFLLIIVIFAISSLPNQIIWLVFVFKQGTQLSEGLSFTFLILHYLNYIINPFIYGGLNKYFLRAYKRLFLCSQTEDMNNTSTFTMPGSPAPPDLFHEGIITRNPVIVIRAGSLDSIYEEAEEEDEWEMAPDKDQTPVSSPPMSNKRVKFKLSVTSNPFRKLSTVSNMSDQEKKERRHRKISQALIQDRQRKLTLPVLAASMSIKTEDKARIRKHSVPVKIENPKDFIFDDSFSLLPPTRTSSSSLKDKLNLLARKVSPSSSLTDKLNNKSATSRRRKTGMFNVTDTDTDTFYVQKEIPPSCFDQISEESEESSHTERSSLISDHYQDSNHQRRREMLPCCKTLGEFHRNSYVDCDEDKRSLCCSQSTNSVGEVSNSSAICFNSRGFDLQDVKSTEGIQPGSKCSNADLIYMKESLSLNTDRSFIATGSKPVGCANDSDNEELDKMLEEIENLRDSWYLDGTSDVQDQFCYLLEKLEKHSLTRHSSTSKSLSTRTLECKDISRWSYHGGLSEVDSLDDVAALNKRNQYRDYDFESLDEMPESYI